MLSFRSATEPRNPANLPSKKVNPLIVNRMSICEWIIIRETLVLGNSAPFRRILPEDREWPLGPVPGFKITDTNARRRSAHTSLISQIGSFVFHIYKWSIYTYVYRYSEADGLAELSRRQGRGTPRTGEEERGEGKEKRRATGAGPNKTVSGRRWTNG